MAYSGGSTDTPAHNHTQHQFSASQNITTDSTNLFATNRYHKQQPSQEEEEEEEEEAMSQPKSHYHWEMNSELENKNIQSPKYISFSPPPPIPPSSYLSTLSSLDTTHPLDSSILHYSSDFLSSPTTGSFKSPSKEEERNYSNSPSKSQIRPFNCSLSSHYSSSSQVSLSQKNIRRLQLDEIESALFGDDNFEEVQSDDKEPEATQIAECSAAASEFKKEERGKRKTRVHLSLDVLKPQYGKKLNDVAHELGVGRSTVKRACREYGIDSWPWKKNHTRNPSLFEREIDDGRHNSRSNSLQHPIVGEDGEKVMVKVQYEEDTIRFELCLLLGVAKLVQEVATAFSLKKGTFKLKYLDEDKDEILLTRDADLQLCPKSRTATGKICIQLFVQLREKPKGAYVIKTVS